MMAGGGLAHGVRGRGGEALAAPLLLVCAAVWLVVGAFVNAYEVPNTDFFAFWDNALSYLRLELPDSLKRLPVYPVLIGMLSRLMPGPEPVLPAALWLNALLVPLVLWLAARVARRLIGRGAAVAVAAVLAASPTMVFCATQPLLEVVFLSLILGTVSLALVGSRWAYLTAALASLTRYEAVALIFGLVAQDWLTQARRRRAQALALGALASSGLAIWLWLSAQRHAAVNPYVQEMLERRGNPFAFLFGIAEVAAEPLPGGVWNQPVLSTVVIGATWALVITGIARLAHRHGRQLLVPGVFVGAYTLIHMVFPAYKPHYVAPILWAAYVAIAAGLEPLWAGRISRWPLPAALAVGVGVAGLLAHSGLRLLRESLALGLAWALLSAALVWAWRERGRIREAAARPHVLLPLVGCALLVFGIRNTALLMRGPSVRDNGAQFKALASWYRQAARPGDRMAVTMPWVVEYYSGLPASAFVRTASLAARTPEEAAAELKRLGATYVVWDSDYGVEPWTYHRRRYRGDLLAQLRARPPAGFVLAQRIDVRQKVAEVFRLP